ncbi:hypothetical protein DOTSEDRAFT_73882 [Dothistroma septosporum NZE10]|uniref:Uncharacterized protein n=1 Tax=Dothistroma septosporum (strain NZE10 / CBS 128990) TaxID=675120 RepID=N1PJ86_DOTSN|nr:hypothetical protein DOTSEDRAFT_73882 [Dothistroma septosporum NZE10]
MSLPRVRGFHLEKLLLTQRHQTSGQAIPDDDLQDDIVSDDIEAQVDVSPHERRALRTVTSTEITTQTMVSHRHKASRVEAVPDRTWSEFIDHDRARGYI